MILSQFWRRHRLTLLILPFGGLVAALFLPWREPSPSAEKQSAPVPAAGTTHPIATAHPTPIAPPFANLRDQDGQPFVRPAGAEFMVLVAVDNRNGNDMKAWSDDLFVRLPQPCQLVRILDVHRMSRAMESMITGSIKLKAENKETRIYLDWLGEVARHYGASDESAAVICLDRDDQPLRILQGLWTAEAAQEIVALYSGLISK